MIHKPALQKPGAILFCCSMNAIRSPMASALFRTMTGHAIYSISAGVQSQRPDGFAIEVMREIHIDISQHEPRTFGDLNDGSFDIIITLSPEAHAHIQSRAKGMSCLLENWDISDPSRSEGSRPTRLSAYRQTRDMLIRAIEERFPAALTDGYQGLFQGK